MERRFGSAILTAALLFAGASIAVPGAAMAINAHESGFLSRLNGERMSRGIDAVSLEADLTSVARAHSRQMAADGDLYHNGSIAQDVGGGWRALGENVGRGPSVESIHDAFMDSPTHRVIILDRDFDDVGVGTAVEDDVIYVTEVFADRESQSPTEPKPGPTVVRTTKVERPPVRGVATGDGVDASRPHRDGRRGGRPRHGGRSFRSSSETLAQRGALGDHRDPRRAIQTLRCPVTAAIRSKSWS